MTDYISSSSYNDMGAPCYGYLEPNDVSTLSTDDNGAGTMIGVGARRFAERQQAKLKQAQESERRRRMEAEASYYTHHRQGSTSTRSSSTQKNCNTFRDAHLSNEERHLQSEQRYYGVQASREKAHWDASEAEAQRRRKDTDKRNQITNNQCVVSPHRTSLSGVGTSYESSVNSALQGDQRKPNLKIKIDGPPRETFYEDTYEEEDSSRKNTNGHRSTTLRETEMDPLPTATCADCGDQIPFENLIEHVCAQTVCHSPLLKIGPGSLSSEATSPVTHLDTPDTSGSRSPFFDRYDQDFCAGKTSSPTHLINEAAEELQKRMERKKQIEAQRAKRQQNLQLASSLAPSKLSSGAQGHRRGVPGSQSSTSVSSSSSKSSSSSLFARSTAASMTPSSSNERVGDSCLTVSKPCTVKGLGVFHEKASSKGSIFDLQQLEGLVQEIKQSTLPESKKDEKVSGQRENQKARVKHLASHRKHKQPSSKSKLCSICLKEFERGQPMVQKDGKIFCIDDYADLFLEKCRKCQQPVQNVGVRSRDGALAGLFHRDCFSCLQCNARFQDNTFYVYDGAPYCAHDYHALNGTLCSGCGKGIEGQCRTVTDESSKRFHPRCLTCQFDDGIEFCKDLLQDFFIFDGKRLCEWHFQKVLEQKRPSHARQQSSAAYNEIRAARRKTLLQTVEPRKVRA